MNWIELGIPYDTLLERNLSVPGVLMRMASGEEYLIGHVSRWGGTCGCCGKFDGSEIVQAYRVVWSKEAS